MVKGSEIDRDFATAVGIATLQFGRIDQMLLQATLQLRNNDGNAPLETPDETRSMIVQTFRQKLNTIKDRLNTNQKLAVWPEKNRNSLYDTADFRNFLVHGMWIKSTSTDGYNCIMYDRKFRSVAEAVTTSKILRLAENAEIDFDELIACLVANNLIEKEIPTEFSWEA